MSDIHNVPNPDGFQSVSNLKSRGGSGYKSRADSNSVFYIRAFGSISAIIVLIGLLALAFSMDFNGYTFFSGLILAFGTFI